MSSDCFRITKSLKPLVLKLISDKKCHILFEWPLYEFSGRESISALFFMSVNVIFGNLFFLKKQVITK